MTTIPVASARRERLRTGLVLATATAAAVAAALLAPRRGGPAARAPLAPARTATGITVGLSSSHVQVGLGETYLAVALQAPERVASTRSPASLAIVIDHSSSMRGLPMEQAKAAAMALIDRLAPTDEATLVTYSTTAGVQVPLTVTDEAGKARLRAAVARIYPDGDTAISSALAVGTDELSRATKDVRRLVLLSDGRPTVGITDPDALVRFAATRAARGVSITAIGLGVEYNERLMAGIASAGRGNYHFVERGTELASLFVRELDSLGQTVLADSELRITTAPGVTIEDVLGYAYERDAANAVRVPVADLGAGARTKVVVRLATTLTGTGAIDVATVRWSYRLIGGATETREVDARATRTADVAVVAAHRDATVVQMIEEARTAVTIDEAAAAYADGEIERAQAMLRQRATEAATQARELGNAELDVRVKASTDAAAAGFAAPPPSAAQGKASAKARRADAYQLAR